MIITDHIISSMIIMLLLRFWFRYLILGVHTFRKSIVKVATNLRVYFAVLNRSKTYANSCYTLPAMGCFTISQSNFVHLNMNSLPPPGGALLPITAYTCTGEGYLFQASGQASLFLVNISSPLVMLDVPIDFIPRV